MSSFRKSSLEKFERRILSTASPFSPTTLDSIPACYSVSANPKVDNIGTLTSEELDGVWRDVGSTRQSDDLFSTLLYSSPHPDYEFLANVETVQQGPAAWNTTQIILREQDPKNFLVAIVKSSGNLEIAEMRNGNFKSWLASAEVGLDLTKATTFEVVAVGNHYQIKANGTRVLDYISDLPMGGQKFGFRNEGSKGKVELLSLSDPAPGLLTDKFGTEWLKASTALRKVTTKAEEFLAKHKSVQDFQLFGTSVGDIENTLATEAIKDFLWFESYAGGSICEFEAAAKEHGFTIDVLNGTKKSSTDPIIVIGYAKDLSSHSLKVSVDQSLGLEWVDNIGLLQTGVTLQAKPTVRVQFGIGQDYEPYFVVGNTRLFDLSLKGISGLDAAGKIGDLSVVAKGSADADLTAFIGLQDPNHTGKVSIQDLESRSLGDLAEPKIRGSLNLTANLQASVKAIGDFAYKAALKAHFGENNRLIVDENSFETPSVEKLLKSAFDQWRNYTKGQAIGQQLLGVANKPLPLIGKSITDLLGIDGGSLDFIANTADEIEGDFTLMKKKLESAVPGLEVRFHESDILRLLRGKTVEFFRLNVDNTMRWDKTLVKQRIFQVGIPGVAEASADVALSVGASIHTHLSIGLDTAGFWMTQGSGVDFRVDATGTATAKLKILFGIIGAKASGSASVFGELELTIKATPQDLDGKVRINSLHDFVDHVDAHLRAGGSIDLYAKIRFLWKKKHWSYHHDFALVDLHW
jgi:hypothetical protein